MSRSWISLVVLVFLMAACLPVTVSPTPAPVLPTADPEFLEATKTVLQLQTTQEINHARRAEQLAEFWSAFIPVTALAILVVAVALGSWMAIRAFNARLYWLELRRSVMETRSGTVIWVEDEDGQLVPQLLGQLDMGRPDPDGYAQLPPVTQAQVTEAAQPLTPSGSVWMAPIQRKLKDNQPQRTSKALARWLVWQSLKTVGPQARHIPSWRQLEGWTSERWQRAVGILKAAGVVQTEPGQGTYLCETYTDLHHLLTVMEKNALPLSPTPRSGQPALGRHARAQHGTARHG